MVRKQKSEKSKGRRSFILNMGAAMTTGVFASALPAVAMSGKRNVPGPDKGTGELSERLAILEAEKSVIGLYHSYESLLNEGMYDQIPALFTEDGEAVYNSGVFRGRDTGLVRLYNMRFRNGLSGKKLDATLEAREGYFFDISADHLSATARFPFAIQLGIPMISDSVLVSMARLHGGGIQKWREKGECELVLSRMSSEDVWMIKRLEYRPGSKSATVPAFTTVFPDDPAGPDALSGPKQTAG